MVFRVGYGQGVFTADLYGIDSVLVEGAASASISSSASSVGQRIVFGGASASIASSTTATGGSSLKGSSVSSITSSTAIYWNRVVSSSSQANAKVGISAISVYKWQNAPDPTTTWMPADYLERAA